MVVVVPIRRAAYAAKSPFRGQAWPGLTEAYKKLKKAEGRGTKANLEFSGDMLDALEFKRTSSGIKLQITGSTAPQADGHNNFSGKSSIPTRKFLPEKGDQFAGSVRSDIDKIIAEHTVTTARIDRQRLRGITTKRELNAELREQFPDLSVRDAKSAILIDDDLRDIFSALLVLF